MCKTFENVYITFSKRLDKVSLRVSKRCAGVFNLFLICSSHGVFKTFAKRIKTCILGFGNVWITFFNQMFSKNVVQTCPKCNGFSVS